MSGAEVALFHGVSVLVHRRWTQEGVEVADIAHPEFGAVTVRAEFLLPTPGEESSEPEPETVRGSAPESGRELYEAVPTSKPTWDQLGDVTRRVWNEKARRKAEGEKCWWSALNFPEFAWKAEERK